MHSIFTHFPKDRNCDICIRTMITRAPCRRRIGGAVLRAKNFGDLMTADHKVLNEGGDEEHIDRPYSGQHEETSAPCQSAQGETCSRHGTNLNTGAQSGASPSTMSTVTRRTKHARVEVTTDGPQPWDGWVGGRDTSSTVSPFWCPEILTGHISTGVLRKMRFLHRLS